MHCMFLEGQESLAEQRAAVLLAQVTQPAEMAVITPDAVDCFSPTYETARKRFLGAAAAAGMTCISKPLKSCR